jgi:hypothetical protein
MSKSVVTHVSHAKRVSHFLDLVEFPEFIAEKDTGRLRGFRARQTLGSARALRAGDRALAIANFSEIG